MFQIDPRVITKIAESYKTGGYDAEAAIILHSHYSEFMPADFQKRYDDDPSFRQLVDNWRVYAKAYWERKHATQGGGAFTWPAWYQPDTDDKASQRLRLAMARTAHRDAKLIEPIPD